MHKQDRTNINNMSNDFNSLIPNTNFTLEKEENKKNKLSGRWRSFEIHRKPTTTDVIIPNVSCHPREQKTAPIR